MRNSITAQSPLHEEYKVVQEAILYGLYSSEAHRRYLFIRYLWLRALLESQGETFVFEIGG